MKYPLSRILTFIHCYYYLLLFSTRAGYGFVDFEVGACADVAVKALQAKGVQAQMAKVGIPVQRRAATVRLLHEHNNNIKILYPPQYCYYYYYHHHNNIKYSIRPSNSRL